MLLTTLSYSVGGECAAEKILLHGLKLLINLLQKQHFKGFTLSLPETMRILIKKNTTPVTEGSHCINLNF